jgi:hypothetical protein
MISKHLNPNYSAGIPENLGDRYYGQDLGRDFWFLLEKAGITIPDMLGNLSKMIMSGGVVSQGAGTTLNITAAICYAPYAVTIPDTFAALPPSTMSADVTARRINLTVQTNLAIAGATADGATPNYVKVKYAETNGNTRTRAKKVGSYAYELVPSFTITVDSTAPTAYEVCLGTFLLTGGGAFTFSTVLRDFTLGKVLNQNVLTINQANYTLQDNDGYSTVLITTGASDRTITLPLLANNISRKIKFVKVDSGAGKVIIDGNGSETINEALTKELFYQYQQTEIEDMSTFWGINSQNFKNILIVNDTKNQNTAGGTWTAGSWQIHTLSTIEYNTITGSALASNKITLPAGRYIIRAKTYGSQIAFGQIKLYNTTDAADVVDVFGAKILGEQQLLNTTITNTGPIMIESEFNLTGSKDLEIDCFCTSTFSTNGFGYAADISGYTERYAKVFIEKIN